MADSDKSLDQLTKVVTLPDEALVLAYDSARVLGDREVTIVKSNLIPLSSSSMADTSYDPIDSGITATDGKAAIDELSLLIADNETNTIANAINITINTNILNNNSANWITAFGWGDHSLGGYLTSFTELDPVFTASPAFSTTNVNGINTGNNAINSLYSGLEASKQDSLISGVNIKTINGESLLGATDIVIAGAISGSITDNQVAIGATTADSIEGDSNLTYDSTTNDLTVGEEGGALEGSLVLKGRGTGSTLGGKITLNTADDHDASAQSYTIKANTDNLNVYKNAGTNIMTYENSSAKWKLNQYGSGTKTGTATYALNVDATGNIIEGAVGGGATVEGDRATITNVIPITNIAGSNYNFNTANTETAYAVTRNSIINQFAQVFINTLTKPTLTLGGVTFTEVGGIGWTASTDLYLYLRDLGVDGIHYSFLPKAVGSGGGGVSSIIAEGTSTVDNSTGVVTITSTDKSALEASSMYDRGLQIKDYVTVKKNGFLLGGQSNANGNITGTPTGVTSPNSNVQIWNNTNAFADFEIGVNQGTWNISQATYGFPAFLYQYLSDEILDTFYFVNSIQGGIPLYSKHINKTSSNYSFDPKFENQPNGVDYNMTSIWETRYRTALDYAVTNTIEIDYKVVFWYQGESDRVEPKASAYYQNMKNEIAYMRGVAKNPALVWVIARIHPDSAGYSSIVDNAFLKIASEDSNVWLINSGTQTFTHIGDNLHIDETLAAWTANEMFKVAKDVIDGVYVNAPIGTNVTSEVNTLGSVTTSGLDGGSASFLKSGYIPVVEGQQFSIDATANTSFNIVSYYTDVDSLTYISGESVAGDTQPNSIYNGTTTAPATAQYLRFCFANPEVYADALGYVPEIIALGVPDVTIAATSVDVTPATASVDEGATTQLAVVVNGATGNASDQTGVWSSGTPSNATVDQNGLVTGVLAGSSIITFTANDTTNGTLTDTSTITVDATGIDYTADINITGPVTITGGNGAGANYLRSDFIVAAPGDQFDINVVGNTAILVVSYYTGTTPTIDLISGETVTGNIQPDSIYNQISTAPAGTTHVRFSMFNPAVAGDGFGYSPSVIKL